MADVLGPVGAIAIWRAFAHPPRGEDQALQVLPPALFVVLSALPSSISVGLSPTSCAISTRTPHQNCDQRLADRCVFGSP